MASMFDPSMENIGAQFGGVLSGNVSPNMMPTGLISQSNNPIVNKVLSGAIQPSPASGMDLTGFLRPGLGSGDLTDRQKLMLSMLGNQPQNTNSDQFMQQQAMQQPQQLIPMKMGQMPTFNPMVMPQMMPINMAPIGGGGFGMNRARF